jgi:hypothetical protein
VKTPAPAALPGATRAPAPRRADAQPPGAVLGGCEILRVVADSHFGIVYLVREPGTERRLAIKEYLPVSLALRSADGRAVALRGPEHAEAFERGLLAFCAEARTLEQRTHPALLRVLRSEPAHGTVLRVMPWLDGDTLLSLRRSMPEPPEETALKRLLYGLLGALQTLHDAGEVHGAVSPANILVLTDDRPVLMDTDAVPRALVGDQTRALMAMVSPGFAPPGVRSPAGGDDLAAGAAPPADGVAADLHALASVAHFCISGVVPVAGERQAPLAGVVRGLRLRLTRPAYSAALLDAIDSALSDDPARRPASVAEFRAALSGLAEPARGAAHAAASEGPASVPAVTAPEPPAPPPPPDPLARHRARYAGERPHRSKRLAWWGGGALAALALATVSLVVVKERAVVAGRAEAATPAPIRELEPPAAVPARSALPQPAASVVVTTASEPARMVKALPTVVPVAAASAPPARPAALAPPASAVAATVLVKPAPPVRAPEPVLVVATPRAACGNRTEFALYRCMKVECQRPRWAKHAECERLRETDLVE